MSSLPTTSGSVPVPPLNEAGLPVGYPFKPDWEVTPRQVRAWLAEGKLAGGPSPEVGVLLDCRRPDEWERSRIAGAVLIPMQEIERRADELEDEDGGRVRTIVVHCHHGVRSLRVAAALRAMGFRDVRSMAGGIDLWSMDVDPGVPRY
jgi:rhodanese-related sulfurtransferase